MKRCFACRRELDVDTEQCPCGYDFGTQRVEVSLLRRPAVLAFLLPAVLVGAGLIATPAASDAIRRQWTRLRQRPPADVYRFVPKDYPAGGVSKNLECEGTSGGLSCKALEGGKVASVMPLSGGPARFFVDAPGSTNIHVRIGGHKSTTLAGLTFVAPCVLNIWRDGTVEVDREDTEAKDAGGRSFVSRWEQVAGRRALVMTRRESR